MPIMATMINTPKIIFSMNKNVLAKKYPIIINKITETSMAEKLVPRFPVIKCDTPEDSRLKNSAIMDTKA